MEFIESESTSAISWSTKAAAIAAPLHNNKITIKMERASKLLILLYNFSVKFGT